MCCGEVDPRRDLLAEAAVDTAAGVGRGDGGEGEGGEGDGELHFGSGGVLKRGCVGEVKKVDGWEAERSEGRKC